MSDLKQKPFDIPKRLVWEAYRKVAGNKGAAGVDGQSIAEFEEDLKGNLYKLWNRLSSGTYFPPPVRGVEIPRKAGGTRMLGVPTVADRIAQTVVCMVLEPTAEPEFHPDSYGYRPGRSALNTRDLPAPFGCRKWSFSLSGGCDGLVRGVIQSAPCSRSLPVRVSGRAGSRGAQRPRSGAGGALDAAGREPIMDGRGRGAV